MITSPESLPPAPAKRRGLPWFPIVIVVLGIAGLVHVHTKAELERNMQGWMTAAIPLLVIILNLLWFLFTPRFSWRTRLTGLALVVALVFGLKKAVRVDGTVDGTGMPNFAWKWSAPTKPQLLEIAPVVAESSAQSPSDPRTAQVIDVPQFMGPDRDGVIAGSNLATNWETQKPKELWRQPIGAGWSAFAVIKGRAYTQEQRGEEELVTCYDLFTGKLLWVHADKAHFSQWQSGDGPHATPTIENGHIYTYGGTGILNCLDAATGTLFWQHNVLKENHSDNIEWGVSSSPLLVDDKVIVTAGKKVDAQTNKTIGPVLVAFNRETGAPAWQAGEDQACYSSPVLATLAGKRVILSSNVRALTAHDPATGTVVLDYAWGDLRWPKAGQPVVIGTDQVFLSAGYGMGCVLLRIKAEPDGKLSTTELWRGMKMKTQFNSAAVHDGCLYGIDDGRLACVDIATGDRLWKDGKFASGQSLIVDDLILVQNESGSVHLVAAKKDGYKELAKLDALSSKTWNFPTLAGRYLLARNDREVVCYELPVTK